MKIAMRAEFCDPAHPVTIQQLQRTLVERLPHCRTHCTHHHGGDRLTVRRGVASVRVGIAGEQIVVESVFARLTMWAVMIGGFAAGLAIAAMMRGGLHSIGLLYAAMIALPAYFIALVMLQPIIGRQISRVGRTLQQRFG
jgi:hypothetical protein